MDEHIEKGLANIKKKKKSILLPRPPHITIYFGSSNFFAKDCATSPRKRRPSTALSRPAQHWHVGRPPAWAPRGPFPSGRLTCSAVVIFPLFPFLLVARVKKIGRFFQKSPKFGEIDRVRFLKSPIFEIQIQNFRK
jgi:hypothetical protein